MKFFVVFFVLITVSPNLACGGENKSTTKENPDAEIFTLGFEDEINAWIQEEDLRGSHVNKEIDDSLLGILYWNFSLADEYTSFVSNLKGTEKTVFAFFLDSNLNRYQAKFQKESDGWSLMDISNVGGAKHHFFQSCSFNGKQFRYNIDCIASNYREIEIWENTSDTTYPKAREIERILNCPFIYSSASNWKSESYTIRFYGVGTCINASLRIRNTCAVESLNASN